MLYVVSPVKGQLSGCMWQFELLFEGVSIIVSVSTIPSLYSYQRTCV